MASDRTIVIERIARVMRKRDQIRKAAVAPAMPQPMIRTSVCAKPVLYVSDKSGVALGLAPP
ncbi:MAG: hypothetical protein ACREBC_30310 [Pyrinomonadaceae bacterium]